MSVDLGKFWNGECGFHRFMNFFMFIYIIFGESVEKFILS